MAQYPRKLKAGLRWFYKFNFKGKMYRSECIYVTKTEANRAQRKKQDELDQKLRNPDLQANLGLLRAIENRLDYLQVKTSKRYYIENKTYFKILLERFGNVSIEAIKRTDINTLLLEVSKQSQNKGTDNYTVNSMLRIFKALFNHAIFEHDLDIKNPCVGIKPFSIKRKLKYIPSDSDIETVIEICGEDQKKLIEFVLETGCRINEALRLTVADVYDDYIVLYTRKSKNSDLVPRKAIRPDNLYLKDLKPTDRVFSNWEERPKFLEHKVKELGQKNWNWHSLRHRYASKLSKEGIPLFEIMSLLGHSNLKTTQNYLQLLP
jgi:integrase